MTFNGPIGGLIDFAIGGGWGSEVPKENHSRVAVIRGTDIPKVTSGDFSTVPFRYESDKKLANRVLAPGDVVLETAGGSSANGQFTGRTLLITQEILDKLGPTICASFCKKLVLKKDLVDPLYFYLYMQDLYNSGRVASYDSQSTGISNFQYEAFVNNELLALPKPEIQTSVAIALSNLQNKINVNSQISKTLECIAQTIFKSWFIDFDPVNARMVGEKPAGMDAETATLFPNSMKESEVGLIPKTWEIKTLGEVVDISWGDTKTTKASYVDNGFKAYSAKGQDGFLAKFDYSEMGIVLSAIGANCGKTWLATGKWSCIKNTMRIISTPNYPESIPYVYFLTNRPNFWERRGTAQPFIGQEDSRSLRILLPSKNLVGKFSEITTPIFEMINALSEENEFLNELLNTLLPRLISGELQIPEEILAS